MWDISVDWTLSVNTFLTVCGTVLFGGAAGAGLAAYFAGRRERRDVALKLVDYYLAHYAAYADVLRMLSEPTRLTDPAARNRLREMGDWFEIAAILLNRGRTDRALLQDIGLTAQIARFRDQVVEAVPKAPADIGGRLAELLEKWNGLREFRQEEGAK